MSWSSGSEVAREIIVVVKKNVKDDKVRTKIYEKLIDIFEDQDCDTMYECIGVDKVYDRLYNELYPNDDEE